MYEFDCKKCGDKHRLTTLIEFPTPPIISDISSGKIEGSIHVMMKNTFIINQKNIITQVELQIPINDYEDNWDLQLWAEIKLDHFQKQYQQFKSSSLENLTVSGTLLQNLPYYQWGLHEQVELIIDLKKDEIRLNDFSSDSALKEDLQNGIELNKLTEILAYLYHLE